MTMASHVHRSRLQVTVNQFKSARLSIATLIGAIAVLAGCLGMDPQSTLGVVLIAVGTGIISAAIVAAIALEREDFAQSVMGLGVQDVFSDRGNRFDNDFWDRAIKASRHQFHVLGVANHGWSKNEVVQHNTSEAVTDAVNRGVDVEFLWLDPRHELAKIREDEEGRATREETVNSVKFFWGLAQKQDAAAKGSLVLKLHEAMPTCGITLSDDLLVVSHYLSQRLNVGAPGLVLGPSMSFADRLAELVARGESHVPKITQVYKANYTQISKAATVVDAALASEITALTFP